MSDEAFDRGIAIRKAVLGDEHVARAFFSTWAVAMAVVFGSLALVRHHIGRPARLPQHT